MTDETVATRHAQGQAALRIFSILSHWLHENPKCSYDTGISTSGKFRIIVRGPKGTELFFGESVQDAYAQAAQTIDFNG